METKEYGPQQHSQLYYNNNYNGDPEQNELHQSSTPEPGGPQFIFAPQSDPRPPQKVNNGSDASQSDLLVTPKGCVQTGATSPNVVAPTMLGVVACVLAVVCKRMQQLPSTLEPAVHRGKDTTHKSL
ncbi:unnamed protein product [Porites evermanni]|uniref:Uncharacterized protein n=1 Tax=Porites evermanni TaxID=104178 RepID=A0ABN8S5U9_9CNID|nr:unnamed protein product [Porites evermanni]